MTADVTVNVEISDESKADIAEHVAKIDDAIARLHEMCTKAGIVLDGGAVPMPLAQPKRDPIMRFFSWSQLPPGLQEISRGFGALAWQMHDKLAPSDERDEMLRCLLSAKDAAVRASLGPGDPT